ncbi:11292_t:CDS:2 [Diversispora eburnea]|uniref:11292_t:CDS:1 n=1 Tax=Diversispora eburnea TaxID=1213867 RepID=A0A9N9G228_9GLOM|nr:11292_t:CDS:2 [Diversispora eburnea]
MVDSPASYPFKGIKFFFSHWTLIRRILLALFLTLIVAIFIIGLTFGFLLPLQVALFTAMLIPPPFSIILAVIACVLESAIFIVIFNLIATPFWQDALYDDVLKLKGLGSLLEGPSNVSEVTLFCPYCYINGWPLAWSQQIHYQIDIKGLSVREARHLAWKDRKDYTRFGTVSVFLQLFPGLNLLFIWTNIVGAALWTSDIILEERKRVVDEVERSIPYSPSENMESSAITATTTKNYGATDNNA